MPCADICPENAIVVAPSGNARMVDLEKCTGCKICLKACPWEMISFDPDSRKATKCYLCNGKPKCVEACPAESLSYVPWRDLTNKVPPRIATTALIPPETEPWPARNATCPVRRRLLGRGSGMFWDAVKGGRPFSAREFGFRWIDLAGTILLPLAVVCVIVHAGLRAVVKR